MFEIRRYTLAENIISALIGAAIGVPLSLYAVSHQTPTPPVVVLTPVEETIEVKVVEPVYEMTAADLEEEAYYDSLELLAALVQAEAGNQDLKGKRLVVDVVLNRVDNEAFPDDIEGVIYQNNQFAVVKDGALDRAFYNVTEEDYEAVRLEIEGRLDYDILYFTAGGYGDYGTHAYQYGDHYFCNE